MSEVQREKSMAETIRDQLREEILDGSLAVGSVMRQDALAARFSVSRLPIREALRQLESEGLVTSELRRGSVVTAMTIDQVCDLMEVLLALESHAVRLAVPNMVEGDFVLMQEVLDEYDKATTAPDWARLDRRFHAAIMAASGNESLHQMAISVAHKIERYLHSRLTMTESRERSRDDHHAILAACRAGNVDAAVALISEHIRDSKKNYIASTRTTRKTKAR
ncbi:GntR family transcriptional regulator [Burkholderia ubonensis]|uniref:GntR family transcriptional regulator n=1 Tax=Burkholderia ubonensis TaxID=101571 RepID=UPI002ABD287F|nr:GntR family transcriptional regulator [Burkholderia ubonensis]